MRGGEEGELALPASGSGQGVQGSSKPLLELFSIPQQHCDTVTSFMVGSEQREFATFV